MLLARRSAPEHDPRMTFEHSTTARWNKLGVDFVEGGKPEFPEQNPGGRNLSPCTSSGFDPGSVEVGGTSVTTRPSSLPMLLNSRQCFQLSGVNFLCRTWESELIAIAQLSDRLNESLSAPLAHRLSNQFITKAKTILSMTLNSKPVAYELFSRTGITYTHAFHQIRMSSH